MAEWKTVRAQTGQVVHLAPAALPERVAHWLPRGTTVCLPWGRLGVEFVDCDGPVTCGHCVKVMKEKGL